jgi:hypothetical protein
MAFSSTITITGSTNITNFDIFQCPTSGCTGCVAITGSTGENVSRMKLLTGHTVSVDQGYRYIKLVADTATCNNSICMEVVGIPTFTPTPTPTRTPTPTPTPTTVGPTSTPTPTSTPVGPTSTPTSTPVGPTPTPTSTNTPTPTPTPTRTSTPTPTGTSTPTPTPLPGCSSTIIGSYTGSSYTLITHSLSFAGATNGGLITVHYTANTRPNRFNIYGGGNLIVSSLWAGSDTNYTGPWTGNPIDTDGDGYISFVYNSSLSYELKVDVGGSNPDNALDDSYSVTFSCTGPTPTPTATPSYYPVTVQLDGFNGDNGNLQIWQSADNTVGSFQQSLTLTSTGVNGSSQSFNGTPGYYYYMIVARTSGTSSTRLNLYTQVNLTDFSPGPINNAWCSGPNSTPLQSDVFQLPNPIQSRQSITFFGNLDIGCL